MRHIKSIFFIFLFGICSAQNIKYFNILPNVGALENKSHFLAVISDSKYIYTLGNILSFQDSNRRNQVVDIQTNVFNFDGSLIRSSILEDLNIPKPYIGANPPLFKINDSIYNYFILLNTTPLNWADYELISINFRSGKIVNHQRVPRPFPGDYDMSNFTNTSFINGKLNIVFNTYLNMKRENFIYEFNEDLSINKISKLPNFSDRMTVFWLSKDSLNNIELVGDFNELKKNEPTGKINLFYIKLDSNLNVIKRKDVLGAFNIGIGTGETYSIIRNDDRSFIISASDWFENVNGFYGIPYTLKLSPEFDTLIWMTRMGEYFEDKERLRTWINYSAKLKDNSGYVTCGDIFDQRVDSTSDFGIIYKVSNNGDSLWLKKYLPLSWESARCGGMSFYQIHSTEYNSLVVCGYVVDLNERSTKSWLLHLDSDGCLIPKCNETVHTENIDSVSRFSIYPNPLVGNTLNIQCNSGSKNDKYQLKLLSLDGKLIKETNFNSQEGLQIMLDMPLDIPNGPYLLHFSNKLYSKSYQISVIR